MQRLSVHCDKYPFCDLLLQHVGLTGTVATPGGKKGKLSELFLGGIQDFRKRGRCDKVLKHSSPACKFMLLGVCKQEGGDPDHQDPLDPSPWSSTSGSCL